MNKIHWTYIGCAIFIVISVLYLFFHKSEKFRIQPIKSNPNIRKDSMYSYSYRPYTDKRRDRRRDRDWNYWNYPPYWYNTPVAYYDYVVPGYFYSGANDCYFGNCNESKDYKIIDQNVKNFDYSENKDACEFDGMKLESTSLKNVEYVPFGDMYCNYRYDKEYRDQPNELEVKYKIGNKNCKKTDKGVDCDGVEINCPDQVSMTCRQKYERSYVF